MSAGARSRAATRSSGASTPPSYDAAESVFCVHGVSTENDGVVELRVNHGFARICGHGFAGADLWTPHLRRQSQLRPLSSTVMLRQGIHRKGWILGEAR